MTHNNLTNLIQSSLHGLLHNIQPNRVKSIAIMPIKAHKMLIRLLNAQNTILIDIISSFVNLRLGALLGNKLQRSILPVISSIRDADSDAIYLVVVGDMVLVVEGSVSNHWQGVFYEAIGKEELDGIDASLASHQNFVHSHGHMDSAIVAVVGSLVLRMALNFWQFHETYGQGFGWGSLGRKILARSLTQ